MKTTTIKTFANHLGITAESVDDARGLIELPYMNGLLVAVSDSIESQIEATNKLREASHVNKTMVLSCVPLTHSGGSTVIPGVDCRVPVFGVYAGRYEDRFPTNGHRVTSNRLLTLMQEIDELNKGKTKPKTPYLSWLTRAMGVNRPRSLEALQELIVEAAEHPESRAIPAIEQLLVGRGTRHAVLTVAADVEYRDTEPTVSENDWRLMDLERLVQGGITETQASVLRKTSEAFSKAVQESPITVRTSQQEQPRKQVIEMLAA